VSSDDLGRSKMWSMKRRENLVGRNLGSRDNVRLEVVVNVGSVARVG
jgi:hypothetical protein